MSTRTTGTSTRARGAWATVAVVALAVAGCSGGTEAPPRPTTPAPTTTSTGTPTADAPTDAAAPTRPAGSESVELVIASALSNGFPLPVTVWVHPVQNATGSDISLLTVEFERGADGAPMTQGFMGILGDDGNAADRDGLALVDLAGGRAARALRIGGEKAVESPTWDFAAGETLTVQAAFPRVTTSTIDVVVPGIDLVRVPVVETSAETWPEAVRGWATATDTVGEFGALVHSAVSLVTKSEVEVAGDEVLVELPSDVLFATAKHTLSAKAQKVVDEAGAKIAAAAAETGEITVTGHTDDVGTDADNQALSERRAAAVADRLRPILGSGFTIRTVGKGETDPKVTGVSDEERALNRRVEIEFTGVTASKMVIVDDVPTELPPTEGDVVTGAGPARVPDLMGNEALEARMVSVQREDGHIVGVLEVSATGERAHASTFFGDGLKVEGGDRWERGLFSIRNFSLLTPTSRVFASTFHAGDDEEARPVGSRGQALLPVKGGAARFVVVWPDTDPTATTVTVDAPGYYRFVDVPIS